MGRRIGIEVLLGQGRQDRSGTIEGPASSKPLVRFCVNFLYLPFDTLNTDQHIVERKMKSGSWLGVIDRTEETLIGTKHGVAKCRTTNRKPEGQQWDAAAIEETRGAVQQPRPGVPSDRVPTGIADKGGKIVKTESQRALATREAASKLTTRLSGAPRALKIFEKDTRENGVSLACRAFTGLLLGRGDRKTTQYAIAHNEDCRARMTKEIRRDPIDADRVMKAEGRQFRYEEETKDFKKNACGLRND